MPPISNTPGRPYFALITDMENLLIKIKANRTSQFVN